MPKLIISNNCSISGCENKHKSKGFCNKHYKRFTNNGDPYFSRHIIGDPEKKFFSTIEKITETGCWIWMGAITRDGYGRINVRGKIILTHRYSWNIHYGGIADCILHQCDVPSCVNPLHLFEGSKQDNMDDMYKKGRGLKATGESHGRWNPGLHR